MSYAAVNYDTTAAMWTSCTDPLRPAGYYVPSGSTPCISFDSATAPTKIRVLMPTRAVKTTMGGLTGVDQVPVARVAEAGVSTSPAAACGMCVLENTAVSGTPALNVSNAGVHLNGQPTFSGNASVKVTGGTFTVEKTPVTNGNVTLSPAPTVTGRKPDPFASLVMPFSSVGLPDFGTVSKSGKDSCNLQPGRYTSIRVSGSVDCTMAAGLYVLAGGGLSMSGTSSMDASAGVTLYFTCGSSSAVTECGRTSAYETGAGLSVSGTNDWNIKAPTTGPTAGLAIVYDRKNNNNLDYSGTNQDRLVGSVYAAYATMNLSGTADSANTDSMIVVRNLNLSGNGTIAISYTVANNVPATSATASLTR